MYSPAIGRFLQRDPEGFAAGDVNLYRSVRNNPTNLVDPNGTTPPDGLPTPSERGIMPPDSEPHVANVKAATRLTATAASKLFLRRNGYDTAAAFFEHSLQDHPANLKLTRSDPASQRIRASADYRTWKDRTLRGLPRGPFGDVGEIRFEANRDLFFAIHIAEIGYWGCVTDATTISFHAILLDTYDFHWQWDYQRSTLTKLVNNAAVAGQGIAAVNPFEIEIEIE